MNKKLKTVISILVFILCIIVLLNIVDFSLVMKGIAAVNPLIYVFTLLLSIFRNFLTGIRWELLHPTRDEKFSRWIYFRLTMLSHVFNLIMPGALGGDVIRTIYAANERKKDTVNTVISVFVDRIVGLLSIFLLGIVALIFVYQDLDINFMHLLILMFSFIGLTIFFTNNLTLSLIERFLMKIRPLRKLTIKLFKEWRNALTYYVNNKKQFFLSLLICVPIHFISFFIYFIFGKHLGYEISFSSIVFSIAIMWLITALPTSFGGLGVRELTLVWLLGMFGVSSEHAVTLSLAVYVNTILISLISLPFLLEFRSMKKGRV